MNKKFQLTRKLRGKETQGVFPVWRRFLRSEWLIVLAALVCDSNSWGHQFVMDDLSRIVGNPLIKSPRQIVDIFKSSFNLVFGMPSDLYRPLTTLTFAMNHWVSGLNPDSFHLLNRAIHVLTCLGIYWVLRRLFENHRIPAFTALLFAVHPIQTEAITYITGRADALAMMFFVLAWLFFLRVRLSAARPVLNYILSASFYFLALLSKESAITWLGVVLLTEFVYLSESCVKDSLRHLRENFMRVYGGYLLVTGLYLGLRFLVLREVAKVYVTFLDNPLAHVSASVRVLTALKILFKSVGLLFWPIPLSADYSYNQISMITRWNSPAGWVVLAGSLAVAAIWIWSARHARNVFFGISFFLGTYFIVSNLVIPIGTIFNERLLYMPCLGIFWIVGAGLEKIDGWLKGRSRTIFYVGFTVVLLLLVVRTCWRNRDWKNEFTLYAQTVRVAPQSAKAHNNLGVQYFNRNDFEEATRQYHLAEAIKPDYPDLLNNLGTLMAREGKMEEAVEDYRRAVTLSPLNPEIRNNMGLILRAQGKISEAIAEYDRVIQLYPSNADAHFNKGNALYAEGNIGGAISEYTRTLEIDPEYTRARSNLSSIFQQKNSSSPGTNPINK
jgi:Tfp pilus assembly protein PilF